MKKVVIYTGPMCNYCSAAKHLLNKKKVNYTEFDIAIIGGGIVGLALLPLRLALAGALGTGCLPAAFLPWRWGGVSGGPSAPCPDWVRPPLLLPVVVLDLADPLASACPLGCPGAGAAGCRVRPRIGPTSPTLVAPPYVVQVVLRLARERVGGCRTAVV